MKKVALITGASSGMGKVTARYLFEKGYVVYGVARRVEKMKDLSDLGIHTLLMDVTNDASMVSGVETILHEEGRIDVLVNNAGFGSYGAIEDVPIEDARYQLEVNVFGAARLMQLVLPAMRESGFGKIVNISSIGGKITTPFGGWYHASKFALEALSDCLRNEVAPFGVDVIVIEPGGIKSEWGSIAFDNLLKTSGSSSSPYHQTIQSFSEAFAKTEEKNPGPEIIAELIYKAIEAKTPKTRYVAGYMAKPAIFMRKVLSDRMMDKVLMSQLKG
jgi:NAD(P)-dependent dehydrogenase (short-subunit alcohol dehydrogenase family)